jgi:FkbM family methyltransferase
MISRVYLRARLAARGFVMRHPKLDLHCGRWMVKGDQFLQKLMRVHALSGDADLCTYRGFQFRFDAQNRYLAATLAMSGAYEAETLAAVLDILPVGGTFLDLGANLGFYTVQAAAAVGDSGRVIAFEPTPSSAALLRENVSLNGFDDRTTIVEAAVSGRTGRHSLLLFAQGASNSLVGSGGNVQSREGCQVVEVEETTLDSFFQTHGWPQSIDLIKMDIEGQEAAAFGGMRDLLRRYPHTKVIFEYNLGQLARSGETGTQLVEAARGVGLNSFEVLFRSRYDIKLPEDSAKLAQLAQRANVNLLAWRAG